MTDEELLARMRERVARVRKIASMAHDPEMVAMLLQIAEEGDADIKRLETARATIHIKSQPAPQ
jgi:DNA-binding phage protein